MNEEKCMRGLVAAILYQAVMDYRNKPHMRKEVVDFFKSEWGEALCEVVNMDNTTIIEKLNAIKA